ncbi:unnamed protein product [Eruca vesicaria subsp. sativa]|uniref:Uncharacterized protein n=1 Tax=Eruca vesicaria subsp. sativa TaxID=29727 RepID=A0ABC8KDR4_ERUVS|nr:unnamed protein product [Eruca vesicaria subsp. sativa]
MGMKQFIQWSGFCFVLCSLIYESGLKQRLLCYAASALLFTQKGVNPNLVSWNRSDIGLCLFCRYILCFLLVAKEKSGYFCMCIDQEDNELGVAVSFLSILTKKASTFNRKFQLLIDVVRLLTYCFVSIENFD